MRKLFLTILLAVIPSLLLGQYTTEEGKELLTITDSDITESSGVVNWTKDNIYLLDGYVYVEAPTELHIEAGTVIKGKETPSNGSDKGSVLVITRGAKIYAEGTRLEPIIFTAENDNVDLADDGLEDGVDFRTDRGLWGGVVLLGKAPLNVASESVVEGLPETDTRAFYGGDEESDNSGVFRYVSIRYTGITVEANKELQGLTLGTVGSGTVIEYVESFNSDDDGFEFFGGTVNTNHLASVFATDDAFDYDQGFSGNHQFWFVLQGTEIGDHMGEWDSGDEGAFTNTPLSKPVIYNATFIGRGADASGGDDAIQFKEYGGGEVYNSIITDYDDNGIEVDSGDGATSYNRFTAGEIKLENNIWWKGEGTGIGDVAYQGFLQDYLPGAPNSLVDPQLKGIDREDNEMLDPRPEMNGAAYTTEMKSYPEGFEEVDHLGAFGSDNWLVGWTALSKNNILSPDSITSVENVGGMIKDFELSQNYPNPFNPSTKIRYAVPQISNVKLSVYNMLGQRVQVLVDGVKSPGTYEVTWSAKNLASGLYIYQLEAGSVNISKKMMLLK